MYSTPEKFILKLVNAANKMIVFISIKLNT